MQFRSLRLPSVGRAATLALLLLAGACGEDAPRPSPGPGRAGGAPLRPEERAVGQEIWLTYFSPEHALYGRRIHRTREEALEQARGLRQRVLAGEDLGALAREHSNAPGAAADGYTGVLPPDPLSPTARDRALLAADVGEVTPLVEWLGGWWFGRRIDRERAGVLERRFQEVRRERVKIRAIVLLYDDAWLPDPALAERARRTKARAVSLAEDLLGRARGGEDFADLARTYSDDPLSASQGGLVTVPRDGERRTEWLHRFETWVPESVLEAAFETPAGEVHPEVIVSPRGVFVLKVEEHRRADVDGE